MNLKEFEKQIADEWVSLDEATSAAVVQFEDEKNLDGALQACVKRFEIQPSAVLESMNHHATELGAKSPTVDAVYSLRNKYGSARNPNPETVPVERRTSGVEAPVDARVGADLDAMT